MILDNNSIYTDGKFPTVCRVCCIIEIAIFVFTISLMVIGFIIGETANEAIFKPGNLIWLNALLAVYYFGTFGIQETVRIASIQYDSMNPHSTANSLLLSIFSAMNYLCNFAVLCKYVLIGAVYYESYPGDAEGFIILLVLTYWLSNIFKLHNKV